MLLTACASSLMLVWLPCPSHQHQAPCAARAAWMIVPAMDAAVYSSLWISSSTMDTATVGVSYGAKPTNVELTFELEASA